MKLPEEIEIKGRRIGPGQPLYIIAEMSANHGNDLNCAKEIICAASEAGADAVKVQTFTPDTLTIDCDKEPFMIKGKSLWKGRTLYDLYKEACMPWEWQAELKSLAEEKGLHFISTAYDLSSLDFLEDLNVPAYKISSFELPYLELIRRVAETGKPLIMSTGMASLDEISDSFEAFRSVDGDGNLSLLKCVSAYPLRPEEVNLRSMTVLREKFNVPVGFSDHSKDYDISLAAAAMGACILEKHMTLSRSVDTPDKDFSLEADEFKKMVTALRRMEKALGDTVFGMMDSEKDSMYFRRSLFVVEDIAEGEEFTRKNIRAIRPGFGLPPKYIDDFLGKKAGKAIARGTALDWKHI